MLTDVERSRIIRLARDTVVAAVRGESLPEVNADGALAEPGAVFVTLRRGGELRGCIGHIHATEPLWVSARNMARSAAIGDPRFPAVTLDEVPHLHIDVSILSPHRRISREDEVIPGTHGLYVRRGKASGLLLPQVASDRGWSAREFLEQTCVKARLPLDAWQKPDSEVSTFTAEVFGESPLS